MLAYQDKAFREASRVLKDGGFFLHLQDLSTPLNRWNSAGENVKVEDINPYDRFGLVASELHKQLSLHFNPKKIDTEIMYQSVRDRRTEQQRVRGRFVFSNCLGGFKTGDTVIYGMENDEHLYSVPSWHKLAYGVLKHVFPPLASRVEPKSLEILYAGYVRARK